MTLSDSFMQDTKYWRIFPNFSTIITLFPNHIYIVLYCLKNLTSTIPLISHKNQMRCTWKELLFPAEGETEAQSIQVTFLRVGSTKQKTSALTQD